MNWFLWHLSPTTTTRLYSGLFCGQHILFMRQVLDDFAVAALSESIANTFFEMLFDMIDEQLTFPLKHMGLLTLFNRLDILQTADYVKISCSTYSDKIMPQHLSSSWLFNHHIPNHPTPLPSTKSFMTTFLHANEDPKMQDELAKSMKIVYKSSIGELIYAMTTCPPDIKNRRPSPSPTELHGFVNRDCWAACLQAQQSFASIYSRFLGECIGFHTQLLPTVPHSSTDGECMAACLAKQMIPFVPSVLWDLGVPQAAATLLY